MRLNQLEYFVKTVECGGANAAARELSVSQPAISAAIRELEEELGVPLFRRVRQQLILTEEGAAFYRRVGPLLIQLQVAVHQVQAMAGGPQALRLCLPPMIGMFMAPLILGEFVPAHPDLHLTISEAGTDSIQKMLLDGTADLGIMIGQSPYNVGLEAVPLRETRYALFVGRQSPLAGRRLISFRDLAGEPLVLFDQGLYINALLHRQFRQEGVRPNIVLQTNQINTIKDFVGRSVVSTFLIREVVKDADQLIEVPTDFSPPITIIAAWKKGRRPVGGALQLLRFLQKTGRD